MKWFVAGLALLAAAPSPQQSDFRYQRQLTVRSAGASDQACAVLDADVFSHAAPALRDLRLYASGREVPYATTVSEPATPDPEPARVLNLAKQGNAVAFDLAMPGHPYTDVELNLDVKDFLSTAKVTAGSAQLGSFTIFDLTSQKLGRSTTLHLQESTFPLLHVELTPIQTAGNLHELAVAEVKSATIPPSREAQTLYTSVARSTSVLQKGRQTVETIALPMQVPVERVRFALQPDFHGNFARRVTVTARAAEQGSRSESASGEILRVKMTRAGHEIEDEQLAIPFTIGANLQSPATVEVTVENGDDQPLPIASIELEMRQRRLCWPAGTAASPVLFYGYKGLPAPVYDYARLFAVGGRQTEATMRAEEPNPVYRETQEKRPLTERYPQLLWLALIGVVGTLGLVALRSAMKLPK
ncbi:DUF3999 domain-containing protein [Terriglobus tenax]|uniref:DUF3999 domain-containing protein n=1 Tax=Terriglobus tenax TaxID=1111115 RepID=UPI0021E09142|nr:DUF3999 domain-containing protein [Terriglobus tenax]